MTMSLNRIPEKVQSIHLIAVCGTAMGALACMLKDMGYSITGSDAKVYPPMSDFLREKQVRIFDGFDGNNLSYGPDLVVVGNAVSKDNPEVVRMQQAGLCFCSMPQAVNHFAAAGKKQLLVAGTHGKTTTASLLAWVLHQAGLDPSFMIGGIVKNFGSNYRVGAGPYIVIEGDEYDTAFFDKGPKFLHYRPHRGILTSVEFDHADIFRDLDHVRQAFAGYVGTMSGDSILVAFDQDSNVAGLVGDAPCPVTGYGPDAGSLWHPENVRVDAPWMRFDACCGQGVFGAFRSPMIGTHNLHNALGVIAVVESLGLGPKIINQGLESFQGIRRRQEIRGVRNGITVMDDFAHHPTAVQETLRAVRNFYPGRRIVAVFEPRTNTSMRNIFQDVYPTVFDDADLICIRQPSLLSKIPESLRFSSEKLVADLRRRAKEAFYFPDTDAVIDFLLRTVRSGDLVLVMSNGGFDNIHERLLARL